jgi:hypothetical protein
MDRIWVAATRSRTCASQLPTRCLRLFACVDHLSKADDRSMKPSGKSITFMVISAEP